MLLAFLGTLGLGATSSDGGSGSDAVAAAAGEGAGAAGLAGAAATGTAGQAAGAGASADAAAAALQAAASASARGTPGAARMLGVLLLLGAAVLAVSVVRHRRSHRSRRPGDRPAAAAYGLQAGACFGLSAASCRIGGFQALALCFACCRCCRSLPCSICMRPLLMLRALCLCHVCANMLRRAVKYMPTCGPPCPACSTNRVPACAAGQRPVGGPRPGRQCGPQQQRLCLADLRVQGGQRR